MGRTEPWQRKYCAHAFDRAFDQLPPIYCKQFPVTQQYARGTRYDILGRIIFTNSKNLPEEKHPPSSPVPLAKSSKATTAGKIYLGPMTQLVLYAFLDGRGGHMTNTNSKRERPHVRSTNPSSFSRMGRHFPQFLRCSRERRGQDPASDGNCDGRFFNLSFKNWAVQRVCGLFREYPYHQSLVVCLLGRLLPYTAPVVRASPSCATTSWQRWFRRSRSSWVPPDKRVDDPAFEAGVQGRLGGQREPRHVADREDRCAGPPPPSRDVRIGAADEPEHRPPSTALRNSRSLRSPSRQSPFARAQVAVSMTLSDLSFAVASVSA